MFALRKLFKEFIYGGHLLSLGSAGIVWSGIIIIDRDISIPIIFVAYLISQIVYSFDHLIDTSKEKTNNHSRSQYLLSKFFLRKTLLGVYVIAFFLIIAGFKLQTQILSILLVSGGIIYTYKLKYLTKYLIGFKSIYVSFFWSLLVILLYLYYPDVSLTTILSIAMIVFFRLLVNTVYFDIKDIREDKQKGLKTFAVLLGAHKTMFLSQFFNLLSAALIIIFVYYVFFPRYTLILIIFSLYSQIYLYIEKIHDTKKLKFLSYVFVDGEYILWPFVLSISKMYMV